MGKDKGHKVIKHAYHQTKRGLELGNDYNTTRTNPVVGTSRGCLDPSQSTSYGTEHMKKCEDMTSICRIGCRGRV